MKKVSLLSLLNHSSLLKCFLLFLFFFVFIPAGKSQGASVITGIDIQDYKVTITVNEPFMYVMHRTVDPYKMSVELPGVSIGAFNKKILSDNAGIAEIVPSQINSQFLMAKIEMLLRTPSHRVEPEYKDNKLIIRIKEESLGEIAEKPAKKVVSKEREKLVKTNEKISESGNPELEPPPQVTEISNIADDYVIWDGDTLQVSVWGSSQLSASVTVRPDGKITLPGVGDIPASGLTPGQLSKSLTEKLEAFEKKPIVTITVTGITNNKIYVFGGGVEQNVQGATFSGVYFLPGRTTLLKFLCRLGNLRNVDLKRTYIVRNGKRLDVDFYDLFVKGDISKDIFLKAEDIIYMPDNELNKIYVMGAVQAPKYIFYREGIRILDAVLEAGGFTKFAKENNVLVLRKGSNPVEEIHIKVKDLMKEGDLSQNISLMPGDFVIVKEGLF